MFISRFVMLLNDLYGSLQLQFSKRFWIIHFIIHRTPGNWKRAAIRKESSLILASIVYILLPYRTPSMLAMRPQFYMQCICFNWCLLLCNVYAYVYFVSISFARSQNAIRALINNTLFIHLLMPAVFLALPLKHLPNSSPLAV